MNEYALKAVARLREAEPRSREDLARLIMKRLETRDEQISQIVQFTQMDWDTIETAELAHFILVFGEPANLGDEFLERLFFDSDILSGCMLSGGAECYVGTSAAIMISLWIRCILICDIWKGRRDLDGT